MALAIFIMYSIFLIFPEAEYSEPVTILKIVGSLFFLLEIGVQLCVRKLDKGKTLRTLR